MFKTPKKLTSIDIMGTKVSVKIDPDLCKQTEALGLFHDCGIVLLDFYESEDDFIDTFTHECVHALCWIIGLQLNETVEEVIANTTGQMVVKIVSKLLTLGLLIDNE